MDLGTRAPNGRIVAPHGLGAVLFLFPTLAYHLDNRGPCGNRAEPNQKKSHFLYEVGRGWDSCLSARVVQPAGGIRRYGIADVYFGPATRLTIRVKQPETSFRPAG